MKTSICYFILFTSLLLGLNLNSQVTVTIGTGSVLGNHPIYPFYGYTYSQSIYYQSEIGYAGTITAIKFYYQGSAYTDNITVYMGHTTKTEFTSTTDWIPVGSMTQVYSGNYSYGSTAGWYQITLTTPFVYNNTNNLVIAVDENTAGYHTSSDDFYNTNVTPYRSIYYYSDATNPDPSSPPTASARTQLIANVQLVMTVPNCSGTPNAGTAAVSSSTICSGSPVTLSLTGYTAATGITLQWQSGPTSTGPWTNISGATSDNYVVNPSSTTYYRCAVTCSFSGQTSYSNVVVINVNNCYLTQLSETFKKRNRTHTFDY